MALDIGQGISAGSGAALAGANPYFAAAFGLAGALSGGDDRPSIEGQIWRMQKGWEAEHESAPFRGETIARTAEAMGVHPAALVGGGMGSGTTQFIGGQSPRGDIGKDALAAGLAFQEKRESDARIKLLKAQAEAINKPAPPLEVPRSKVEQVLAGQQDVNRPEDTTTPTQQAPGQKPVLQPQGVDLRDAFANPGKYSGQQIEDSFGGIWGEVWGVWAGMHSIKDGNKRAAEFNRRASKLGVKLKGGKFYKLTRRGWRPMSY